MNAKYLIFVFFVLFLSMSVISANELNQNNATSLNDDSSMEIVNYHDETQIHKAKAVNLYQFSGLHRDLRNTCLYLHKDPRRLPG